MKKFLVKCKGDKQVQGPITPWEAKYIDPYWVAYLCYLENFCEVFEANSAEELVLENSDLYDNRYYLTIEEIV